MVCSQDISKILVNNNVNNNTQITYPLQIYG